MVGRKTGKRGSGITGHQSRESPASRRESATAPEAANPPPSSWFLFLLSLKHSFHRPPLSFHPWKPRLSFSLPRSFLLARVFPPRSRAFRTRNHGASRRFSSRSRGNLQITIMEEHLLGEKRSVLRDATRQPSPKPSWRRGVTVPPFLRRCLALRVLDARLMGDLGDALVEIAPGASKLLLIAKHHRNAPTLWKNPQR